MAFVTADRVTDTTTSVGTGAITVSGTAPTGYKTFSAVLSASDTFYYCIQGSTSGEWEIGVGTYSGTNSFTRTTVLSSSNSGSAVSFSAGTKDVFMTLAAPKTVQTNSSGVATIPTLNLTNALGTAYGGTNSTATPTAGAVAYGTGSAVGYSSVGTAGQVLTSNGSSVPTWTTVSGSGTVTSVAQSFTGGLISVSGSPITTAGTLALTVAGTSGGVPYFSGSATWDSSGVLTASAIMVGGGAGAAPSTITTGTGVVTALGQNVSGSGSIVLGTSPTVNNPTVTNYVESVVAIGTVTTTNTIALTNGTVQTATLTASTACTFTMPTATAGKSFVLLLKQAATTGNGTATFTGVKWGTAGAPTITATAGKMDILTFVADGTNWYGSIAQGYTP